MFLSTLTTTLLNLDKLQFYNHSFCFKFSFLLLFFKSIFSGVITSLGDLEKPKKNDNGGPKKIDNECVRSRQKEEFRQFVDMLKLNNAVREIFLNRFIHMFRSYESFVIQPNQVRNTVYCFYIFMCKILFCVMGYIVT